MATHRIPTQFEVHDERFAGVDGDDHLVALYDEGRWLEGPVYSPAWRSVLFSDIPNDRVLRSDETTGATGVFAEPAGYANGRTLDRQGRVITCSHGARAVLRTEFDGSTTVLADRWDGKRLNSPNDVVVRADGSIWFTDPSYGIDSDYEGHRADSETDGCHVYRVSAGNVVRVADDFDRPNGLAFNAAEDQLYVVDTRRHHVRRFDVTDDLGLSGGEELAICEPPNLFDGMRIDHLGRLWVAARDGLHCFVPDGTLLGKLLLPEVCSNLAFGGSRGTVLFITASTTLFSIMVNFTEAVRPPARAASD